MSNQTILVSGAAGQMGRRVTDLLLEAKAGRVIAGARDAAKVADLVQRGAEVRHVDFDDAVSLAQAFAGVDRLLIISTDAIAEPGRRLQQHRNAVAAAAKAGVKHVVYTSMPNADKNNFIFFAPDHRGTEEALAASSLSYTVLRNNWYTDYLPTSLKPAVAMGKLFAAAGEGGAAFITREDCAKAAVAALMSSNMDRRVMELTGPAVVTFRELARLAAEVTGKPVEYIPVDGDAIKQTLMQNGVPELYANLTKQSQTSMKEGLMGPASDTFRLLTGQQPTSVADFLKANRALLL